MSGDLCQVNFLGLFTVSTIDMVTFLGRLWQGLSNTGVGYTNSEHERREVVLLNRAWLLLILIQSTSLVSHLIHGLHRSANMTAGFIAGLFIIHFLIRAGKINAAKIAAIAVINANTVLMAIFFGAHTNLIDFLLLTALLPLYFFEAQNRKLIFWSVALSIVPFALYHYMAPYFAQYELPMGQQMAMFNTTNWVKVLSLAALVFLIYHKNALYEKEVQEKEAQLIGQKKLYECMLDQIPIDIVTFDKQLKYSYINSTAIKDPQIRSWLIGKTNVDYFKERNLDMKVAAERDRILHEALSQEQTVEFEETFVDRHGSLRHSIKGTSPIYSENKELLCLIAYSLDITDIKEAERKLKEYAVELERKNEDLHHFVNATSHDLKTPLRNITSYLQLLEKRNTGKLDGESLSMIAHTIKSVKHLNQLIKDIYHYSIADRNEKPAEITNLQEVLDTVLAEMKNTITEKSVTVQHAQFPVIKASASHMGMVFSNLLSNAIKYNNTANPYIFINAQANDDEYVISVSDNGIGIPVEYNKKIFEIFQRLHTSNEYEGTGVGLAICSKIVENYGGRMWVESEPGKGSVFYFSLAKAIVSPESPGRHKILSYKNFAIAG